MAYRNVLYNTACNNPDSQIAKSIAQGLIFRSKYPFGTIDINEPIKSIEMIAGFDASRIPGDEHSKPRGAAIVMQDPYGKQIKSDYIENVLTHKGIMTEKSIRNIIEVSLRCQETILGESYDTDSQKTKRGTLDYYFAKNPNLPRLILFVYDGDILKRQRETFLRVYKELARLTQR